MDPTTELPTVSVYPEGEEPELISLTPGEGDAPDDPISNETAVSRSYKAQFGLNKETGLTYDNMYQSLISGQETKKREEIAAEIDYSKSMRRNQAISELIKQKQGPLTPDDYLKLDFMLNPPATDPNSVIEVPYSKEYVNYLKNIDVKTDNDDVAEEDYGKWSWADTMFSDAPKEVVDKTLEVGASVVAYREVAMKLAEDVQDTLKNQSWGSWGLDAAKSMVPLYNDVKLRGWMDSTGYVLGQQYFPQLLGANLYDQTRELLRLPFPEYTKKINEIVAHLKKDNPQVAMQFIMAVLGQSTSDQVWDNSMNILDISGVGGTAKAVTKSVFDAAEVSMAVKSIAKSAATPDSAAVSQAQGAGDVGEAAVQTQTKRILQHIRGTTDPTKEALEALPSGYRTDISDISKNPGYLGADIANKLSEAYTHTADTLMNMIATSARVDRIPAILATERAQRVIKEQLKSDFKGPSNSILDISKPVKNVATNTYDYEVLLGKPGGELFFNRQVAKNFADMHGLGNYKLEQKGLGWYIRLRKPLRETDNVVRDLLFETKASQTPSTWISSLGAWVRTPEEVLSLDQRINRKIAVFGPSQFMTIAREESKLIQKAFSRLRNHGGAKIIDTEFRTQSGSTYRIARDGTTIRTASYRTTPTGKQIPTPAGTQRPASERTVYMSPADAQRLVPTGKSWRIADNNDGTISIIQPRPGAGWSPNTKAGNIPYSQTPTSGMVPVELFTSGKVAKYTGYRNMHIGSVISDVTTTRNPGRLSSQRWSEFKRTLNALRSARDPETGDIGRSFRNPVEMEDFYLRNYQRLPDGDEIQAYFAFKRLLEMDRVFLNIEVYKHKSRVGVEQHRVYALVNGERKFSDYIEGVQLKALPGGDDTVAFIPNRYEGAKLYVKSTMSTATAKDFREGITQGRYKIYEIYDPERRPLKTFSDNIGEAKVRYVITQNMESKPLSFDQVPRRGGGHFEYDYDMYIKQANIKTEKIGSKTRHYYEGDNTIMPVRLRAMGKDIASKLDHVRVLLKEKKIAEAKAYAQQHLPIDWKEVHGWFRRKKIESKIQPPRLSLNEPIQVVPRNKMIGDMDDALEKRYGNTYVNGTRHGSLARSNQVQYTQQRDSYEMFTMRDEGTAGNPLYKVEPAELVDAIPTMERALSKAIHGTFLDDYKTFSVEHWLAEAGKFMKPSEAEIRSSPFYHFRNPDWKAGADKEEVSRLKGQQYQIEQLVGTPSAIDGILHSMAQRLADSMYTKFGSKGDLVPSWMLTKLKDPAKYLRAVTYHYKLGFWTIPQLWVQLQTVSTIGGLAPRSVIHASFGALLSRYAHHNKTPAVLDALDRYATKLRMPGMKTKWKPGEFKESTLAMRSTGFDNVGREQAIVDDSLSPNIFQSGTTKFLEAGTFFFREGERLASRYAAWHASYLDFRRTNPTGRLTDANRKAILERADLLAVNMSSASKSMLHSGALSVTTQFLTYQLRLAELFWGKRITMADKARLFMAQSVLYGIPTAVGITGLPFGDAIRKKSLENGYVVGDNYANTLMHEGLPSLMLSLTGTTYNVGDRFGSKGFTTLQEATRSDNPIWEIIGGASFGVFSGMWEGTDGFRAAMMSAIRDDGYAFPIKVEDFVTLFKEISSVNNSWRAAAAFNTHRWVSKKGAYLDDASPAKAIFMYLTGLQNQNITDANLVSQSLKDQKALQDYGLKKFIQEFRSGLDALRDKNPTQQRDYMIRAFTWLKISGYPDEKVPSAIRMATEDYETMPDRLDWNFYIRQAPQDQAEIRQKAYRAKQQMKQEERQ